MTFRLVVVEFCDFSLGCIVDNRWYDVVEEVLLVPTQKTGSLYDERLARYCELKI